MSESKTTCPRCGRAPGGIHGGACPRNRARLRSLDVAAAAAGCPRLIWMSAILVSTPGVEGRPPLTAVRPVLGAYRKAVAGSLAEGEPGRHAAAKIAQKVLGG